MSRYTHSLGRFGFLASSAQGAQKKSLWPLSLRVGVAGRFEAVTKLVKPYRPLRLLTRSRVEMVRRLILPREQEMVKKPSRMRFCCLPRRGEPERLKGAKLFVVSRYDENRSGPRLPEIIDYYDKAHRPKRMKILRGSAHAQFIFDTEAEPGLLKEITAFLPSRRNGQGTSVL